MTTSVRCPSDRCLEVSEVETRRLGRSMHCPRCGARMTARPLSVDEQLRRQERRVEGGDGASLARLPFVVLVDNVRSLWNVGSILRTADGCGVERVFLAGITGHPPRAEISKTALGAEEAVAWSYYADADEALSSLVAEGYTPVALETSREAVSLESFHWPERLCLVVGNEVAGVSPSLLESIRHHVRIPMRGAKESLNVAVAFGIAAHHAAAALPLAGARR